MDIAQANSQNFIGRNRRLLNEWKTIDYRLSGRNDVSYNIAQTNNAGLPTAYIIDYKIKSICAVENINELKNADIENKPIFANRFILKIELPDNYPCIDAQPSFRFLSEYGGEKTALPWHPNIRYFGEFAGRVCLNLNDTYNDLAWGIERIALYLKYELYHAAIEPPYPEDIKVAEWVIKQGEPNEWIFFDQDHNDNELYTK